MVNVGHKKKPRTYSRKRYNKSAKAIATNALKLVKKNMSKVEVKNNDISSNFLQGTTPTVTILTAVPAGTGSTQRVGNKISLSGLSFRFYAYRHPSSVLNNFRIVIVQDTQTISDGSSVTWGSVFSQTNVVSLRNVDTQKNRFKILMDKTYQFSASENGHNTSQHWIPVKASVLFNGTASTDIQKNAIYVLTYGDDNTNQTAVYYYSRLYYTDA